MNRIMWTICGGLLVGVLVAASSQHGHALHAHDSHDHDHHSHAHSHDGHVHTHEHSHAAGEEHPAEDMPGDHHECTTGHGDSLPIVLTVVSRDSRRAIDLAFFGLQAATGRPFTPEPAALAPPDHPPRPPTRQDALPQLQTIVLLT